MCSIWGIEKERRVGGWGWGWLVVGAVGGVSITKLNTKIKLPASYCGSLRTEENKLRKFVSEVETGEGGWGGWGVVVVGGRVGERGQEQCFCCWV